LIKFSQKIVLQKLKLGAVDYDGLKVYLKIMFKGFQIQKKGHIRIGATPIQKQQKTSNRCGKVIRLGQQDSNLTDRHHANTFQEIKNWIKKIFERIQINRGKSSAIITYCI
jgi:hypothetical protein